MIILLFFRQNDGTLNLMTRKTIVEFEFIYQLTSKSISSMI